MKRVHLLLVLLIMLFSCILSAQTRQWTSGPYKVEAEFVELTKDGYGAILKNAKGVKVTVPLKQLSPSDQDWIAVTLKNDKSRSDTESNPFGALLSESKGETDKVHEKYALLVGVNSYEHLRDLRCAVSDTELLNKSLLKLGFKEENISILKTSTDVAITPTKDHIKAQIKEILSRAKEDDLIFFSFSGHGIQRDEVPYFCPQESKNAKDPNFTESLLSLTEVMKELSEHPARFKWLVVDACRNDPGRSSEESQYDLQTINDPPRGIALMQSCSPKEKSWEDKGHGLFTRFFSEALSGQGDANRDGRLTMTEVFQYTTYETNKESQRMFREPQRPRMSGDYSDFVIVDDLLIDGLTRKERKDASELYEAACKLRRDRKFKEAKEKITAALKIYPGHQEYLDESGTIEGFLQAEADLAKQKAETEAARKKAERLAKEKAEAARKIVEVPNPASDFEYTESDGEVTITKLKNSEMQGKVVIPRTIDGLPVTSIGDLAFSVCKGLTSVTIPESVTSIGNLAFYSCEGLTSVMIPEGVTSIGDSAFSDCSGLTSVMIPGSVTSIGNKAFSFCKGLTSVTIPEGVTSIGDSAFSSCHGLTSVTIPEGVTSIGAEAFSFCNGLTSIEVASGNAYYQGIDGVLFTKDGKMIHSYPAGKKDSSYRIPETVTSIGNWAFWGCDNLTSIEVTSENAHYQSIDGVLFTKDGKMIHRYPEGKKDSSYRIPEGVTSIGEGVFSSCYGLTSVTIPEGVTSIGDSAFSSCHGLTSVTIPGSVTSIGAEAFSGCIDLTSVTIPGSVTSIGDSAFLGCKGLTSVTIPEGVTSIGYSAFMFCDGLTSVTIPESVTSIGEDAFYGCDKNLTIRAPQGSVAENYANEKGIKFETMASSSR